MRVKERDVAAYTGYLGPTSPGGWNFYGANWLPPRGAYPCDSKTLRKQVNEYTMRVPYSPPLFLGKEHIAYHGRGAEPARRRGVEPDVVMKDCFHRKLGFISKPCSWYWTYDISLPYYFYYLHTRLPVFYSNWITDQHMILPTADTRAMSSRAWWSMQPRFEGEISMLNFIYEMKDFRDIAKYALRLRSGFMWDNLLESLRKSLPECAAQPTKTAAQLHLVNAFAIKPLVADLLAIDQMLLKTVDDAQSQFAESGSKFQKKHYSEIINQAGSWTNGEYNDSNMRFMKYGNVTVDRFTATLRYQYKYNVRSNWVAFMRYWGLRPTAEVIWNAVPFSFIVDYFIKIGNSLKAMELDPNVMLTRYQYCESVKRTLNAGAVGRVHPYVKVLFIDDVEQTDYEDIPLSGYFGSVYSRVTCQPNRGLYLPRTTWPNGAQALNMAALLRCFL